MRIARRVHGRLRNGDPQSPMCNGPITNQGTERQRYLDWGYPQPPLGWGGGGAPRPPALASSVSTHGSSVPMRMGTSLRFARAHVTTLDRKSWKNREKLFKSKDSKRFRTPSNQPSLGDRLLHEGVITSQTQFSLAGQTTSRHSFNHSPTPVLICLSVTWICPT